MPPRGSLSYTFSNETPVLSQSNEEADLRGTGEQNSKNEYDSSKKGKDPMNQPSQISQPLTYEQVAAYSKRVLALPRVTTDTSSGDAKQINTALAKMANALNVAIENLVLTDEQRQELGKYRGIITKGRIVQSARNNTSDFKSCDSAFTDLEAQIIRAEQLNLEGTSEDED